MKYRFIISSFLFLLAGAYLDNARGPLLPLFKTQFDLSYTQTSVFLVGAYLAAILCTLTLIPLTNRYGERPVALWASILGLGVCLIAHAVDSFAQLLTFGILLGATVSIFGALCNVLILRGSSGGNQARLLSGLHTMYGVGSLISPLVVSWILSNNFSWPWVLSLIPPFLIIAIWVALGKMSSSEANIEDVPQSGKLSPTQVLMLTIMGAYVGGEVILSMWLTSFLVKDSGLTISQASPYLSGFFFCMVLSRVYCLFFLKPNQENRFLWLSLGVAVFFFLLGRVGWHWGFMLAGLMGPFFPIFLAQVSRRYPDQWRSMTIWVVVSMQITLAICHFAVGRLTDYIGIQNAYWLPMLFFGIAAAGLTRFQRQA